MNFNPLNYRALLFHPTRLVNSAWTQHVPFGMFAVEVVKPKILVELGTEGGTSYCAFCQTVSELGYDTRCYAVDLWIGDEAAGYFGDLVLANLRAFHDPRYAHFSRLIQSSFDEAVRYFEDGSIDLLHIDGTHTYEAVSHDFETWLPKLSDRAVVLFHDMNVHERDFGVWKFWEEVRAHYPGFAMLHEHGLGVLLVGKERSEVLLELANASPDELLKVRTLFYELGARLVSGLSDEDYKRARLEADTASLHLVETRKERDHLLAEVERLQSALSAAEADTSSIHLAETLKERDRLLAEVERLQSALSAAEAAGQFQQNVLQENYQLQMDEIQQQAAASKAQLEQLQRTRAWRVVNGWWGAKQKSSQLLSSGWYVLRTEGPVKFVGRSFRWLTGERTNINHS